MRALYIETFYGGSHEAFANQYISASCHDLELITLPARFWKWRQVGAAMRLAEIIPSDMRSHFDAAIVSGMIDLSHLKVLRPDLPPILIYFHENQFAYPLGPGETRDDRYGLTDVMNILASDKAAFNSRYNRDSLFSASEGLFRRLPDAKPKNVMRIIKERSVVLYPGVVPRPHPVGESAPTGRGKIPLVIWNHRHEHDKNPGMAFEVLFRLAKRSVPFELAILGERFTKEPEAFELVRKRLGERIIFDGYPARREYDEWLEKGSVVISTALQENFGLSMIEAAQAGCWPLMPRRLAYPEVMPKWVSGACFWDDQGTLEEKMEMVLKLTEPERRKLTEPLAQWLRTYDWPIRAQLIDEELEHLATRDG